MYVHVEVVLTAIGAEAVAAQFALFNLVHASFRMEVLKYNNLLILIRTYQQFCL